MEQILFRSASFIAILILGYLLKRSGYLGQKDYQILAKVVLGVTLPAAVLTNFASYTLDVSLLLCVPVGFALNWVQLLAGSLLSRKRPLPERAVWVNCVPSYNIGTFSLPFVQSFLSPAAVVGCCLFDAGNALMCNGGTYALTCQFLNPTDRFRLKDLLRKLVTSIPFMAYLIMLVITLVGIRIPTPVVDFVSPIAGANPFMAMFMLGTMFDIRLNRSQFKQIAGMLAVRLLIAVVAALVCYFLLPLPLQVRQALTLVVFAPVSITSTTLSQRAGGDPALAACLNSFTIPISICCTVGLLTVFGTI